MANQRIEERLFWLRRILRPQAGGYTLMELLVVMIIISLMAAMTVPMLAGSLGSVSLQANTKKIAAVFRFARQQSIMRQTAYSVLLDTRTNTVSAAPSGGAVPPADRSECRIDKQYAIAFLAGTPGRDDGTAEVTFYSDGSSSGGRILVRDPKARQMVVDIDLVTGIATISDG